MAKEVEHLAARLTQEGEKARDFFRGLSAENLTQPVYTDGAAWKAKDLLAHLVATEAKVLLTLTDLLAGRPGLPEDFDLDAFNESEARRLSTAPPDVLLDHLATDRAALVELVAGLHEPDLDRPGRHPWLGDTTLREMLQLVYRHTMLHIRDVRRALEAGKPVPSRGAKPRATVGGHSVPPGRQALIGFLEACHAQTWPRLQQLAQDHGDVMVYPGDPSWRVREVLAHLADAEQGLLGQAKRVAQGEPALPIGFDLRRWNRRAVEKRAVKSPQENLHDIEVGFQQWIDFIVSLDEKSLAASGVNAEGLTLTVEGFARRAAQHRLDHTRDMDQAIRPCL